MKDKIKFVEEKLKQIYFSTDLDTLILDCINDFIEEDYETFRESLLDNILYSEIIYYHNAMKYLLEEDCSLQESCMLAKEHGYELEDINSELLATLLYRKRLMNDLEEHERDIIKIKEEIDSLYTE